MVRGQSEIYYVQKKSLLVTTYNSKDNLAVTLENIGAQDYADVEVLIVGARTSDSISEAGSIRAIWYLRHQLLVCCGL